MIKTTQKLKRCPRCKNSYPPTIDYFQVDRAKRDGLFVYCKSCANIMRRERYWKDPEKWRAREREYKIRKILAEA